MKRNNISRGNRKMNLMSEPAQGGKTGQTHFLITDALEIS